jgi:hypothetical protein
VGSSGGYLEGRRLDLALSVAFQRAVFVELFVVGFFCSISVKLINMFEDFISSSRLID